MGANTSVRRTLDSFYRGIPNQPGMYGTPSEIEAMWWVLLNVEGSLVAPRASEREISDAIRGAVDRAANACGWPSPLPLHVHARTNADLVPLLVEVRADFLRRLAR